MIDFKYRDDNMAKGFKLIIPTMEYENEIQNFRQEFLTNGGDMPHKPNLFLSENWIKKLQVLFK